MSRKGDRPSPGAAHGTPPEPPGPPVEFIAPGDPGDPAGTTDSTDSTRIDFVECPPPPLSAAERWAVDRHWAEATAANPTAFDGPLVAALGLDRPAPGRTVVRWARMTYRSRALRSLRPPGAVPGSVYVTVLLPTEEGLVLGRGSRTTATPGRWSLPGGGAEPPPPGQPLDLAVLRRHAAVELAEEVGLVVRESELGLWALTRGARFGSLGFHFLAPAVPAARVRRCHAGLIAAETARGLVPELDELAFTASDFERSDPDESDAGKSAPAPGPCADYLPPLLARYRGH
ncbi:NUDIX hydrolase [Streptomyces sp. NPDC048623]|uniref:NUDIX hydrolase n=1 Tax=Streptomyces sp. NPDC048623 TaxID=3155761 RepID=UPI003415212E